MGFGLANPTPNPNPNFNQVENRAATLRTRNIQLAQSETNER